MPITSELRARRLTGAAALGYVVLAGVENMEALRVPLSGAGVAEIRAVYADQALAPTGLPRTTRGLAKRPQREQNPGGRPLAPEEVPWSTRTGR